MIPVKQSNRRNPVRQSKRKSQAMLQQAGLTNGVSGFMTDETSTVRATRWEKQAPWNSSKKMHVDIYNIDIIYIYISIYNAYIYIYMYLNIYIFIYLGFSRII